MIINSTCFKTKKTPTNLSDHFSFLESFTQFGLKSLSIKSTRSLQGIHLAIFMLFPQFHLIFADPSWDLLATGMLQHHLHAIKNAHQVFQFDVWWCWKQSGLTADLKQNITQQWRCSAFIYKGLTFWGLLKNSVKSSFLFSVLVHELLLTAKLST